MGGCGTLATPCTPSRPPFSTFPKHWLFLVPSQGTRPEGLKASAWALPLFAPSFTHLSHPPAPTCLTCMPNLHAPCTLCPDASSQPEPVQASILSSPLPPDHPLYLKSWKCCFSASWFSTERSFGFPSTWSFFFFFLNNYLSLVPATTLHCRWNLQLGKLRLKRPVTCIRPCARKWQSGGLIASCGFPTVSHTPLHCPFQLVLFVKHLL